MRFTDPPTAVLTRRQRQAVRLWQKRRHGRAGERTARLRALVRGARKSLRTAAILARLGRPGVILPRIELELAPRWRPDVDPDAMAAVPLDGLRQRPDGRVLAQDYRREADRLHTALARGYSDFVGLPATDTHWRALAARLLDGVRWFNETAELPRPGATLNVSRHDPGPDEYGRPRPIVVLLDARFPDLCYVDPDHPRATEPPRAPDETREAYLDRLRAAYRKAEEGR